jgi:hypothetical protein
MTMAQRIPKLEAAKDSSSEARESPETASEEPYKPPPNARDSGIGGATQAKLVGGVLRVGLRRDIT